MTHLLIVEDHHENRDLLGMLLEANGYRVTAAGDGLEALAAARRDPPDAIVSDALMPNMDGFALCRAWMRDARLKPIPFIFYSATHIHPRDEQFAEALGAVRYLVKPLQAEAFLAELRAVLEQWVGHAAPGPAAPLDDLAFHALHESALARLVQDKIAQLETARRELDKSEQNYRRLFEANPHAMWVYDLETLRFLAVNDAAVAHYGYSRGEFLAMTIADIRPPEDLPRLLDNVARVEDQGVDEAGLWRHRRKDGTLIDVEITSHVLRFQGRRAEMVLANDVTERKIAQAKIQRLTRLYAALSQCNQAIVRCASEEELFLEICRIAVQFGGMKMARVSIDDPATRMVRAVAGFGHGADDLSDHNVSSDADSALGRGPTGTAIRENRPVWCQDMLRDVTLAPWHERALRLGVRSVAALPLQRNGVVIGVFTVFYGETNAFDEPLRDLFVEMATDIGFALDNFAREAEREAAVTALRAAEEQFRGLVEQSIAGIYIIQDDKFAYVNPRFAEIFGYDSVDELIGRDSLSLIIEKDRGAVLEMRRRVEGEVRNMSYAFTAVRKDGGEIEVGVHSARATHRGRPAVIGLAQDISEKKRAEEQIQRYVAQIESTFMSTVRVVTTLGEMRDPYTAGHQRRVAEIAAAIGAELGFDARRQEGLRVAGYLHDIGKLRIPSEILSKPGKLNPIEFRMVQGHAQAGFDALKDVEFPWPVAEVALQHHERMDGSGYPQGLKGEAILFEARIMVVANMVDALCSHRPYRAALGIETALAEIERGRGSAYDAEVADACLRLFREKGYQLPA